MLRQHRKPNEKLNLTLYNFSLHNVFCEFLVISFKSNNLIIETYKTRDCCKRVSLTECRAHRSLQTPALNIDQELKILLKNEKKRTTIATVSYTVTAL